MSSTLVPHLAVNDADKAIDFYVSVFGAEEVSRFVLPDKTIAHAELSLDGAAFSLGTAMAEYQQAAPDPAGPVQVALTWYCPDVDAVYARAVAGGATGIDEPSDVFTGDRIATLRCPFGHRWVLATHLRDVDPNEQQRAFQEMVGG